jgi:hypothetical protein
LGAPACGASSARHSPFPLFEKAEKFQARRGRVAPRGRESWCGRLLGETRIGNTVLGHPGRGFRLMSENEGISPFQTAGHDARMTLPESQRGAHDNLSRPPLQILRRII